MNYEFLDDFYSYSTIQEDDIQVSHQYFPVVIIHFRAGLILTWCSTTIPSTSWWGRRGLSCSVILSVGHWCATSGISLDSWHFIWTLFTTLCLLWCLLSICRLVPGLTTLTSLLPMLTILSKNHHVSWQINNHNILCSKTVLENMKNNSYNYSVYGDCQFVLENLHLEKSYWLRSSQVAVIIVATTRIIFEMIQIFQVI